MKMKKKRSMIIGMVLILSMLCFVPSQTIECSKKTIISTKTVSKKKRNLNSSELETIREGLYSGINNYRKSNKKKILTKKTSLKNSATTRSKEIVNKFSHTRPNGKTCFTTFSSYKKKGYTLGENLAKVSFTAKNSYSKDYLNKVVNSMMNTLKNSKSHKSIMLDKDFTKYGIGITVKKNGNTITVYSVHHFSNK